VGAGRSENPPPWLYSISVSQRDRHKKFGQFTSNRQSRGGQQVVRPWGGWRVDVRGQRGRRQGGFTNGKKSSGFIAVEQ